MTKEFLSYAFHIHNYWPTGYLILALPTSEMGHCGFGFALIQQMSNLIKKYSWMVFFLSRFSNNDIIILISCVYHHEDVIEPKHFPRYGPFVREIHRSPVNFPHKGQWRGALMFSLICAWINGWVNNGKAGDLRRHRAHYDVTVMYRTNCQIDITAIKYSDGLH